MTASENEKLLLLLVDYWYPFDRIRDHTADVALLEAMTAIWRSI